LLLLARLRTDFDGTPLAEHNGMHSGSGKYAARQQQKADEYAKRAHGVAQLYDFATIEQKLDAGEVNGQGFESGDLVFEIVNMKGTMAL
jgi:hypothetical protein